MIKFALNTNHVAKSEALHSSSFWGASIAFPNTHPPQFPFTGAFIGARELSPWFLESWTVQISVCVPFDFRLDLSEPAWRTSPQAPRRESSPGTWTRTSWSCRLCREVTEAPTAWYRWGYASSRCQMCLALSSILKAGLCLSQRRWNPRRTLGTGETGEGGNSSGLKHCDNVEKNLHSYLMHPAKS